MKPFRFSTAVMVPALLALATPAAAQDWVSSMMQTTTDNMTYHAMTTAGTSSMCAYEGVCSGDGAGETDGTGNISSINWLQSLDEARQADIELIDTSFAPNPSVTPVVKEDFLSAIERQDPEAAGDLRQALSQHDFIAEYETAVAEYGFKSNDLSDALASYWVLSWALVNQNDPSTLNHDAVVAVRDQVRAALSTNQQFQTMSDAELQKITESLIINFILNAVIYNTVTTPAHADQFNQVSEATRQGMKDFLGLDLARLDLTRNGFSQSG